ncbi:hypothetical protein B0T25DRAFT_53781 [Lasiosphaeria hispida]|uniref:Uncharacterized protein n=1 Tax=Lasiosphaeria hispida TaxID=260671 RepID=A0AAJ0HVR0_9PEZI|nr:hypothetical protein B0T25DRAFT_53781 [Lasiosphaeria hispida]
MASPSSEGGSKSGPGSRSDKPQAATAAITPASYPRRQTSPIARSTSNSPEGDPPSKAIPASYILDTLRSGHEIARRVSISGTCPPTMTSGGIERRRCDWTTLGWCRYWILVPMGCRSVFWHSTRSAMASIRKERRRDALNYYTGSGPDHGILDDATWCHISGVWHQQAHQSGPHYAVFSRHGVDWRDAVWLAIRVVGASWQRAIIVRLY